MDEALARLVEQVQAARAEKALLDIRGVGPARRRALLERFGSLAGVRSASLEELKQVDGVSDAMAARIHEAVHKEDAGR